MPRYSAGTVKLPFQLSKIVRKLPKFRFVNLLMQR
jgi:hypothetical protein